jgi:hypothetical protein
MGVKEKALYSSLLFLFIYVVGFVLFRTTHWLPDYEAHMYPGIVGLVAGLGLFMFLLGKDV